MSTILFVCVHNAGRSQMAARFFNAMAEERGLDWHAESAGTQPADQINPLVAEAMGGIGLAIDDQQPRLLTSDLVSHAAKIITMGCGVEAEACPAGFYLTEDWGLDDPAGEGPATIRRIRDEIRAKVAALIEELTLPRV